MPDGPPRTPNGYQSHDLSLAEMLGCSSLFTHPFVGLVMTIGYVHHCSSLIGNDNCLCSSLFIMIGYDSSPHPKGVPFPAPRISKLLQVHLADSQHTHDSQYPSPRLVSKGRQKVWVPGWISTIEWSGTNYIQLYKGINRKMVGFPPRWISAGHHRRMISIKDHCSEGPLFVDKVPSLNIW